MKISTFSTFKEDLRKYGSRENELLHFIVRMKEFQKHSILN